MSGRGRAAGVRLGSLFSGYGGLDMAVNAVFGSETAWHCEFEDAPSRVLAEHWPDVPNHRDVTTVDWSTVEPVDILAGGFPCQDLSLAGRRSGMRPGTRSGLWADFKTAIDVLSPSIVVIENVRGLLSGCAESDLEPCPGCVGDGEHRPVLRALGRVLGDLADLGFDAEWGGIRASDVGAPHGRYRVFVVAWRCGLAVAERELVESGSAGQGGAPVDVGGRDRVPVALFRTPAAAEADGGPRNPDREGATMRLSDQVREEQERGLLLPTPVAQPSGNSPEDHLRKKPGRAVVTDLAILAENGLFETGGRLLPTPRAARGGSASETAYALGGERDDDGDEQGNIVFRDSVNWGPYEPAVRRWEALTRPAPAPTKGDGRDGKHRLAPEFVEWMMGLLDGHVTGHGLSRRDELRMLGNGVHLQQGVEAIRQLWTRAVAAMQEEVAS